MKSKNMLQLNKEFLDALNTLEHEYINKYSTAQITNDDAKAKKDFRRMMEYYFGNRTKNK